MANETRTYSIQLEADNGKLNVSARASAQHIAKLEKELKDLQAQQKRAGKSSKALSGNVNNMGRRMQDAASSMAVIQGPLGGVAGRMATLSSVVNRGALKWVGLSAAVAAASFAQKKALTVFLETENQLARINSQLDLTGRGVGFTTSQLDAFARDQARLTLSSSEQIREAISVLLTFKSVSGDTFKDAIKAANAISAVTGASVKSSATQLGKALEDARTGLTALRRQGISFSDEQRKEIIRLADEGRQSAAMEKVIAIINEQIPDASRGVGVLAGSVDSLAQSWRELLETVAQSDLFGFAVDTLDGAARNLTDLISPTNASRAGTLAISMRQLRQEIEALEARPQGGGRSGGGVRRLLAQKKKELALQRQQADELLKTRNQQQLKEQQVAEDGARKQQAIEDENVARIAHKRELAFAEITARTRIQLAQERAQTERKILQDQLRDGEISYADYYQRLDDIETRSVDLQISSVKARLATLRNEEATVVKIRQETDKLVALDAKKIEIKKRNNAQLETEKGNLERERQLAEQQLQTLTGNQLGAKLVAIENEHAQLKRRLEANGLDSRVVDNLINVKKARAGLDEIDRRFKALVEQLNRDQQGIDVDISSGVLTELQGRREILRLNQRYAQQIKELIPEAEKLADATGSPEAVRNVEVLVDKVEELGRRTNIAVNEVKGSFEDAFVDSLSGIGTEITTIDELWRNFSSNVLSSLQRIAAERLTAELFSLVPTGTPAQEQLEQPAANVSTGLGVASQVLGAAGSIDGGDQGVTPGDQQIVDAVKTTGNSQKQGIIGQLVSLAASIFAGDSTQSTAIATQTATTTSVLSAIQGTLTAWFAFAQAQAVQEGAVSAVGALAHSGRVIGSDGGASRRVNSAVFAGAPRLHTGGFAGLSRDEVPAILQKREEVLAADDPRNALNGGLQRAAAAPPQVNVMNVLDSRLIHDETATFLNSGDGEKVVVNIMQKNRSSLGI